MSAVLVLFALVQHDDPDGLYWAGVYLLGAFWPGLAAFRPGLLASVAALRHAAWAACGLFLVGFATLAGTIGRDWIHVEEAREALGYLICAAVTALACWSMGRPAAGAGRAGPTRS